MANKRPKPEEIVSKLRQVEVLMGQGMPRLDAISLALSGQFLIARFLLVSLGRPHETEPGREVRREPI